MKQLFAAIHLILTLNCEQSARLTCDSFERKLSTSEKIAVSAHQWICKSSRSLGRQLRSMDAALQREFSACCDHSNDLDLRTEAETANVQFTNRERAEVKEQKNEDSVLYLSDQARNRILSAIRSAVDE